MSAKGLESNAILEQAIMLARQSSWETFSLAELAEKMNCSLSEIRQYFRSKDDMAEALFDRADTAMLGLDREEGFQSLPPDDKLVECIMCWFLTLAPYKPLVREMLAYKFEPGHFHLQAHGITRVSRTVQWFLEASGRRQSGLRRIADEIAITSAYLTSFSFFLFDKSREHRNTRSLIYRLLRQVNQGHRLCSCGKLGQIFRSDKGASR